MKRISLIQILFLVCSCFFASAQSIPNDTIIKKDGTKIIDNFKTLRTYKGYLITSIYELSMERIESVKEEDLSKIAIPLDEIDKVIGHNIYEKKRKEITDDDVIWTGETHPKKKMVWVYSRLERKSLVLPNGKITLMQVLIEGPCDLYIDYSLEDTGYGLGFNNFDGFMFQDTGNVILNTNYYVYRKLWERKSTVFEGAGEFIKTKKIDYFDNCPEAKAFIDERKKLSKAEVIQLVELYNDHCK